MLIVLACSAMGVYGIVLAGWASGSTYPLLGGLRSAAQMVSYEIAMGLSIVAVFLYAGSMSTSEIVAAQADGTAELLRLDFTGPSWFAVLLPVSFVIYVVAVVGETNRAPFDLPEAESELVGGFHTEYSSLKFALFFLAEYVNMVTVSALAATLFLGGWRAPWPISIWDGANTGWWPLLWFFAKVVVALFVFIWLRGTLPRLRYDQFMRFGWKVLVPTALVWILVVATMRTVSREADLDGGEVAVFVGVPIALVVLAGLLIARRSATGTPGSPAGRPPPARCTPDRARGAARQPRAGTGHRRGGFPVPPMDLRVPPSPRLRSREAVGAGTVVGTGRRGTTRPTRRTAMSEHPRPAEGGAVAGDRRTADAGRRTSRLPGPAQGFGVTFAHHVQEGDDGGVPRRPQADQAPLPRPARAQPAPRRPGEVRRLRAVRLGLPGRRDLRRGRRQHRGGPLLPG